MPARPLPITISYEPTELILIDGPAEIEEIGKLPQMQGINIFPLDNQGDSVRESLTDLLNAGIVGGGQGAFIGAVHRMAAALDGKIELVAGAFPGRPLGGIVRQAAVVDVVERTILGGQL